MNDNDVYIVSAARTPIGSFSGSLKDISAVKLGALVIEAAIQRAGIQTEAVEEVIMGNVLQAGLGQNPARQSALLAGIPVEIPAVTVNQVCGSGLKAIQLAWQAIRSGESEIVVAGGMESMSQAPYLLQGARSGLRFGDQTLVDSMIRDGLWCANGDYHMGITAENLCDRYALTREQLDQFAFESHMKAVTAISEGRFKEEIVAVEIPQRKGDSIWVDTDEFPRADTSLKRLAALRPAFKNDGMVTAGNSSGINDGASALVVMSGRKVKELGLMPLAVIRANASVGVEPAYMGLGPIPATKLALLKAGLAITDIDLIEANEAFAAQSLTFTDQFEFDQARLNVNGGAIALGHPIGASGARIMTTLLYEMQRRQSTYGLATLCIGGGQGVAVIIERC
ncbi:acetyl-CoA C-acetyltransferase [Paenibacillus psychroresistens]|uniref:acetyl-CoA C-acetyltransferase n=1 Tax=Paenibacillus psychroresistens TaxID=1778678 RepID=A0A6B8RMI3_9BACL|nr:acetyl-CoA C-acetyltransferase [Paenibacillus psychroresistens]QGQ97500.1 acetyl-CoA C-acetyltransferase [Paenibacillus psychroresistens]